MKHQVESKYKDPDKYIERLKEQVVRAWEHSGGNWDLYQSARGKPAITWSKGTKQSMHPNNSPIEFGLRLGQKIAMIGKITKIHEQYDSNGKPDNDLEYELQETRILE